MYDMNPLYKEVTRKLWVALLTKTNTDINFTGGLFSVKILVSFTQSELQKKIVEMSK